MTAAALVFWLFDSLPFQDLPAHAGFIALRHRFAHSPFDQRFFVLAPHLGPYSLFRTLGEAFLPLFGPVGAIRVIATLPVLAIPLALLWARRRLHGERTPTAAYYGLSLSFGFMTLLGFASYLLGVAALIVTLTVWLELLWAVDTADRRAHWLEACTACLAPLLFVAHGHAFAIFLALAGLSAVATGRRWARILRLRALGPALVLAGWVAWSQRASVIPPGSAPPPNPPLEPHFQGLYDKLSLLLSPTLLTRTGVDVLVGLVLWAVLLASVITTARVTAGERTRTSAFAHVRALVACMAGLFAAFLAMPHSIGWFGFVDGRLVLVLLLLAVMAARKDALPPLLAGLFARVAPVAAWTMITIAMGASWLFQSEARGWREVLAHVPAESRLLNLPLEPNSRVFTAHPFVHYDKLALAERPIVVSDVWFHQGSALYPTPENPALQLPSSYSESDLRSIDWPAYRMDDWDYVLIRTRSESSQPRVPDAVKLAAHQGGWWLFRAH
ncbi:MAG: hypothetical protein WBY94_26325 [Polyangiaceae bacterium]